LTASRTGEVIGAKWPEFDLAGKVWTVPASRMKANRQHRVPLSDAAVAVVEDMAKIRLGPHIFPGWKDKAPLSDMAMLECLRGLRPGFTVHGFRSSFRDWAAECTSCPREIAEAALAHTNGDRTEAAYLRSDLVAKRRELMVAWAKFCLAHQ
jgi:integrase